MEALAGRARGPDGLPRATRYLKGAAVVVFLAASDEGCCISIVVAGEEAAYRAED
jgi:hypothetical protein